MALTKSFYVVQSALTMIAGAADVTGGDIDVSGAYEITAKIRLTNVGALGAAGYCKLQISEDTTTGNYMTLATLYCAALTSAYVTEYIIQIPNTSINFRIVSGGNTTNNVTLRVVLDKITAV